MNRTRIIFSGSGGQGVITAAIMLAEAAVIYANLNAVQSQTYGAEARGGATRSDIIVSDEDIFFPKVIQANILVCLTQSAYNKYKTLIRPGGLILTDSRFVHIEKKVDARQKQLPMWETVIKTIGNPVAFNICMLGSVIGSTKLIPENSVLRVLEKRFSGETLDFNKGAFTAGLKLVD